MKINLEELQHQRDALDAILKNFPPLISYTAHPQDKYGVTDTDLYANPILLPDRDESKFIDVKMETGTGKTYVYTRMMYELNVSHGLTKFIVVVPSLAIKAGAKSFMSSDYAKQHFSGFFPNKQLQVYEIKSGDFAKKNGRYQMSNDLVQFTSAMTADKNTIHVLLVSDKGYLDKNSSSLFKSHYDQSLWGSARTPAEALLMTRPIVIIDEPHRFKRDGKSYRNIISELDPPMIVRFGATFPVIEKGKHKGEIDYYNSKEPVYDLNAMDAFNDGLVKGVEVIYPDLKNIESPKYKVKSVANKNLVLTRGSKEFELSVGENLSVALNDTNFDGDVTYDGNKVLSTGLELAKGTELVAGTFNNSYQEVMLIQLINEHFEKEQDGFLRDGYKIKTISLAFIDSISSYRNNDGWLRLTFEKLLKAKVNELIEKYKNPQDAHEVDYYNYLLATRASLNSESQEVHGGYFAKDWGEADDSAITAERLDILEKERTLTFKKSNGTWNLRRFFFSKWTLREGWDNPNVFVIAKLRSSGSEISKLQEVGRGLRLPVDEAGRRISTEDLYVSYIVDFSEKEFASKLIGEINADTKLKIEIGAPISKSIIEKLIDDGYGSSKREVQNKLADNEILDDDFNVIDSERLLLLLPAVAKTKIKERPNGKKINDKIKLKRENWNEIKAFWQDISKRYMIKYEELSENELKALVDNVMKFPFLVAPIITASHEKMAYNNDNVWLVRENRTEYKAEINLSQLSFGEFLSRIATMTNLPMHLIYEPIFRKLIEKGTGAEKFINTLSLANFKMQWDSKFKELYGGKYEYDALSYSANTSVLKNGEVVESLPYGTVGRNIATDIKDDKRSLFEAPLAYDSEIEREIMQETPDEKVIVFGKVPRRAIQIPTYTGGTTTPDFVYVTKNEMKLLVEAKSDDLRDSEGVAIEAQEALFNQFANTNWVKATNVEAVRNALNRLE